MTARAGWTVAGHVAMFAAVLVWLHGEREMARVVVFTYILEIFATLVIVSVLSVVARRRPGSRWVSALTRSPTTDAVPVGLRVQGSRERVGVGGNLLVLTVLAVFSFLVLHAEDRKLVVDGAVLAGELGRAASLAALYLVHHVLFRTLVLKPGAPAAVNLAYHAGPFRVLAIAFLVTACIMAWGRIESPLVLTVALLFFRHVREAWRDLKA